VTGGSAAPRISLARHPDSLAHGAAAAAASLRRVTPTRLRVRYWLSADPESVIWPTLASTVLRLDMLWRATCCEVFVRAAGDAPYREWNFSPAGHWQAYDFSARRAGQRAAEVMLPAIDLGLPHPRPALAEAPPLTEWMLTAEIDVPPLALEIGVTMVVADKHGRLDYWALAHGTGAPDFHDPHSWLARV
jgi:hypothetical protein